MTSRSIFGGNEQSTGSHYGHGTQPDSYYPITYSSAAYEPDVNLSLSATSSQPTNLALGERPLFGAIRAPFEHRKVLQTLIDIGVVAFWVGLSLLCMLASIGAFFALLLFKF